VKRKTLFHVLLYVACSEWSAERRRSWSDSWLSVPENKCSQHNQVKFQAKSQDFENKFIMFLVIIKYLKFFLKFIKIKKMCVSQCFIICNPKILLKYKLLLMYFIIFFWREFSTISYSNSNVNFTPFFTKKSVLLFHAKGTRKVFVIAPEFPFLLSKSKRVNKCNIGNLLGNLPEQPGEPCPPSPSTHWKAHQGGSDQGKNNGISGGNPNDCQSISKVM